MEKGKIAYIIFLLSGRALKICNPLTSLLNNQPKSLSWNSTTTKAFQQLLEVFFSASALVHPDPELPFIVEVDASTTGVGAVLSQRQGDPPVLHLCAFFLKKMVPPLFI